MNKQDQIIVGVKRGQDNSNAKRVTPQPAAVPDSGTCLILSSVRLGPGCVCDVELLANGKASGLRARGAISRGQVLVRGDRCAFSRTGNQPIQLFAGGTGSITGAATPAGYGNSYFAGWVTP